MKRHFPIAILLVAFFALALFYSLILPLFEGPDEDDHFRFAKTLADTHALPVQEFAPGGGAAGHQAWQPPLYYALAALVISPLDTSDYTEHLWRNNAATFVGDPACCGRNIYFHTAAEDFPFTGTTLAVHLARLLSVIFGAITVAATWSIAQAIQSLIPNSQSATSGPQHPIPLAAAAIVAFNPSFLFASALVSNDAMLAALSALVLLVWVRLLTGKLEANGKSAALLGLLLGLALLTKTTALGLLGFSVLVILILAWRRRDFLFAVAGNAVMLGMAAALAGGWFVRNQILYGDPLAYRLMTASALFPRSGPLTLPELLQISLPWLWQTFWGGPTPGDFSPVLLLILAGLTALAAIGLLPTWRRITSLDARTAVAVLAAWLAFILVAQIQFIRMTTGADQGRYLFPAIPAFALLFVLGFTELVSGFTYHASRTLAPHASAGVTHHREASPGDTVGNRQHAAYTMHLVPFALAIGSFALALAVPFAYTLPAYAHPALASDADLARISHPTQINFADRIQLLGYDLGARAVKPGEVVQVTLYWRAIAPMPESYRVFIHLIGQGDATGGGADVIPARGAFPTVYWHSGDTLRDVVSVPVAADARPGKYALEVGLYSLDRPGERLTVSGGDEDRVIVDWLKIATPQPLVYAPQTRLDADFGGKVKLLGYDWKDNALVLYWQCLARLDRDYTVFVHVVDAQGKILAQADREPQDGFYPTSLWDVGEQVRDAYALSVTGARIEIGLYRADTFERLPVASGDHVEIELGAAR